MEALSVDHVQFRIFAALAAVLILKNVGLALLTGTFRTIRGAWNNPEDARLARAAEMKTDDTVERIRRAHWNALENDPFFLFVGLLFLLVGAPVVGIQAYGYTYVIARLVHPVAYILGVQPFRTISFAVGVLCISGMAVQVLMKAFA